MGGGYETFAFNFCLECAVVLHFQSTCGVLFICFGPCTPLLLLVASGACIWVDVTT